jgi:hypothetical protein
MEQKDRENTFEQVIVVEDISFNLVKVQRDKKSAVYKSKDGSKFLRIGEKSKMDRDLNRHKGMIDGNLPVSKIISQGAIGMYEYFLEESLGDNLLGSLFKKDFESLGKISDENFNRLIQISTQLLQSQIENSVKTRNWSEVAKGIHLDWIIEELPELKEKITKRYEMSMSALDMLPFSMVHGDYNPYNILEGGIIDFEDGFYAPVIFDVGATLLYAKNFPLELEVKLEINGGYRYSDGQIQAYADAIDNVMETNNLPKFSDKKDSVEF